MAATVPVAPATADNGFKDPLLAIVETFVASGFFLNVDGVDDETIEIIARQMTAALERGDRISPDDDPDKGPASGVKTSMKLRGIKRRKLTLTFDGL